MSESYTPLFAIQIEDELALCKIFGNASSGSYTATTTQFYYYIYPPLQLKDRPAQYEHMNY